MKYHAGTEGRDFEWKNCVLMNFRKQAMWEQFIDEIEVWAKRGISGIRIDTAQSLPLILKPDESELLKGIFLNI